MQIQYSFLDYAQYMLYEWNRRQRSYESLPDKYKVYLTPEQWEAKQSQFRDCILANARFLVYSLLQ